tara:strand:+ start:5807 stop:6340 length:534 start_codon:yes stop_codon:yes gene_type:complete
MAQYLAVASAVVSGIAGYRANQAKADQLKAEAKQTEIQGRADAVEYKRQSVEVMRRMNAVISANIARAGARGLNPYASGGVTELINNYNRRYALKDVITLRQNAKMAKGMAQYQAGQYRTSANTVMKLAPLQMFSTIGMGVSQAMQMGGPGSGNPMTKTSTPGANTGISYSNYGPGY